MNMTTKIFLGSIWYPTIVVVNVMKLIGCETCTGFPAFTQLLF